MAGARGIPPDGPTYVDGGFFALRTPLLPWSAFLAFGEGGVGSARPALRERLRLALERPELREAIFVAAPSLFDRLAVWVEGPDSEDGMKIERAVVRYFSRMAGRATPFGLFAGCSIGQIRETTHLSLGPAAAYRRHTRLDSEYLSLLMQALRADPSVAEQLAFRPNTSAFRTAERVRYVEMRRQGVARIHQLVAVEISDALEVVLERARDGATIIELTDALCGALRHGEDALSYKEARELVLEIIEAQLLTSDLEPQVTGTEPIHELIEQLGQSPATLAERAAQTLRAVRDQLAEIDTQPLGVEPQRYRDLAARLAQLPAEANLSHLFQVDLVKPAVGLSLGRAIVDDLRAAALLLHRLRRRPASEALDRFRDAFTRRYEGCSVPLLEVLDEELGIGFERSSAPAADTAPLLAGLSFPREETPGFVAWGALERLLLNKMLAARERREAEIVLTVDDLAMIGEGDRLPLPDSMVVVATLIARSSAAVDSGEYRLVIHNAHGPSGANLLGRFCHSDETLADRVRDLLSAEEALHPDVVFAEVVHVSEDRMGNVLLRPLLRRYEIPFLGRSGAPRGRLITLDDLFVTVEDGRIVLRSRRLRREIRPRLTTAHNFAMPRNLGVYRFLCALQTQDIASSSTWSWGPLASAKRLPRVVYGRLILALARWNLTGEELKPLAKAKRDERAPLVEALRSEHGLPRWVGIDDGNEILPLDFDNALSVDSFAPLVASRGGVSLIELITGEGEGLCVTGPEGSYVDEPLSAVYACCISDRAGAGPRKDGDETSAANGPGRPRGCVAESADAGRRLPVRQALLGHRDHRPRARGVRALASRCHGARGNDILVFHSPCRPRPTPAPALLR